MTQRIEEQFNATELKPVDIGSISKILFKIANFSEKQISKNKEVCFKCYIFYCVVMFNCLPVSCCVECCFELNSVLGCVVFCAVLCGLAWVGLVCSGLGWAGLQGWVGLG